METMNFRKITNAREIPENAVYYTSTATSFGKNGISYYRLLDKDFSEIERVNIVYTDSIAHLVQVSDESDNVDYHSAKMVYHLVDRNQKGFWICQKINY